MGNGSTFDAYQAAAPGVRTLCRVTWLRFMAPSLAAGGDLANSPLRLSCDWGMLGCRVTALSPPFPQDALDSAMTKDAPTEGRTLLRSGMQEQPSPSGWFVGPAIQTDGLNLIDARHHLDLTRSGRRGCYFLRLGQLHPPLDRFRRLAYRARRKGPEIVLQQVRGAA